MAMGGPAKRGELVNACAEFARRRKWRDGGLEDVAQDSCLRALEVAEPDAVREPLRYLLRIARNLFIDSRRRQKRETALFRPLAESGLKARDHADPERILAGKQDLTRVLRAIENLPPRCREAFTLHRFEGLSYAAAARRMGVGTGTVEKHIAEAMLRILRAARETERTARD